MTSTTFFIIFIPILSLVLLCVNLLLAPHNPYEEKDSVFECGFHSFLGQNRTQFSVSFFIFGLLFLLFDLEIILVYPYSVSSYNNDIYGLAVMMIFFVLLTLGFVFELGKNALTIDSKQSLAYSNKEAPELGMVIYLDSAFFYYITDPLSSKIRVLLYNLNSSYKDFFYIYTGIVEYVFILISRLKRKANIVKTIAVIMLYFFTHYIGLNSIYGIILIMVIYFLLLVFPCIISFFKKDLIKGSLNLDICSYFILIHVIVIWLLTDLASTVEFKANYLHLSRGLDSTADYKAKSFDSLNIYVLLIYTGISCCIYNIVHGKSKTGLFSSIKSKLVEFWPSVKNNPFKFICAGLGFLFVFALLVQFISNLFGINFSIQNVESIIISLWARITLFNLLFSLALFTFTGKREQWYSNIGINPFTILALIPYSLFYYFCLLPLFWGLKVGIISVVDVIIEKLKKEWIEFKFAIVCIKNSTFNYIKKEWVNVNLNTIFCIKLKSMGEYFISTGNISARLGKLFVQWASYNLANELESIKREPFLSTSYTPIIDIKHSPGNMKVVPWFFGYKNYLYFPNMKVQDDWKIMNNPDLVQKVKQGLVLEDYCLTSKKDNKLNIIKLKEFIDNNLIKRITSSYELSCNTYIGVNSGTSKEDYFCTHEKISYPYWLFNTDKSLVDSLDPRRMGYNVNLQVNMQHNLSNIDPKITKGEPYIGSEIGEPYNLNKGKNIPLDNSDYSKDASGKYPSDNDEIGEEESFEIEEELEDLKKLIKLSNNAMILDEKLPYYQKDKNRYLNKLRKDPHVQDFFEGKIPHINDLPELNESLKEAREDKSKELYEAKQIANDEQSQPSSNSDRKKIISSNSYLRRLKPWLRD